MISHSWFFTRTIFHVNKMLAVACSNSSKALATIIPIPVFTIYFTYSKSSNLPILLKNKYIFYWTFTFSIYNSLFNSTFRNGSSSMEATKQKIVKTEESNTWFIVFWISDIMWMIARLWLHDQESFKPQK